MNKFPSKIRNSTDISDGVHAAIFLGEILASSRHSPMGATFGIAGMQSDLKNIGGGTVVGHYAIMGSVTREESPLNHLHEQIAEFESLPFDWNGHESEPPSKIAIALARNVLDVLSSHGLRPDDVRPSAEGGIGICFRNGHLFASIECFNTGEIVALTSDGTMNPHAWEVPAGSADLLQKAAHAIGEFIKY